MINAARVSPTASTRTATRSSRRSPPIRAATARAARPSSRRCTTCTSAIVTSSLGGRGRRRAAPRTRRTRPTRASTRTTTTTESSSTAEARREPDGREHPVDRPQPEQLPLLVPQRHDQHRPPDAADAGHLGAGDSSSATSRRSSRASTSTAAASRRRTRRGTASSSSPIRSTSITSRRARRPRSAGSTRPSSSSASDFLRSGLAPGHHRRDRRERGGGRPAVHRRPGLGVRRTRHFPGSPNGCRRPRARSSASNFDPNNPTTTGPNDPNCTSCAFIQGDPNFATRCPKDGPNGANGYLDPQRRPLNTRFYHQKLRFGSSPGTRRPLRPRHAEHDGAGLGARARRNGNYVGDQDANANCVNPIYAQNLPDERHGTRRPGALHPHARDPRRPTSSTTRRSPAFPTSSSSRSPATGPAPAGTAAADCPQKDTLSDNDWKLIEGNDPENYDFSGADFHMVENWDPRTTPGADLERGGARAARRQRHGERLVLPSHDGRQREGSALRSDQRARVGDQQGRPPVLVHLRPHAAVRRHGQGLLAGRVPGRLRLRDRALNAPRRSSATRRRQQPVQVYGKAYPSARDVIAKAMSTRPPATRASSRASARST